MNVTPINNSSNTDYQTNHIPLPPPICVRGVSDSIELRNQLIKPIGSQNFNFKSSETNLVPLTLTRIEKSLDI